jgi:hypothetical protein
MTTKNWVTLWVKVVMRFDFACTDTNSNSTVDFNLYLTKILSTTKSLGLLRDLPSAINPHLCAQDNSVIPNDFNLSTVDTYFFNHSPGLGQDRYIIFDFTAKHFSTDKGNSQ